jgi:hypothetical protein
MPLFNLFKKPSKKEPVKSDDSLFAPEMQKKRYDAAMEFLKSFQERMPLVGGKPHAGTVLSIPARLAGTSLYRSLDDKKEVAPGIIVLSNEVNEAWPQLMNLFAFYCKQNGIDVMSKSLVTVFPESDKPRMSVEQVQQEYQDQYDEIMRKHGLDTLNAARAGMVVCSIIFRYHCTVAKDIAPDVATGIIAMGVVEGAKTAPPPLKAERSAAPTPTTPAENNPFDEILRSIAQNSIDGSGNRLVLGEEMMPMQEALSQGGKYILVHPEVVNQLEQNSIDPFLVYETAMRIELASKIPRIDFVGNVDVWLQAWSGKPEAQAPIHVRQALWLQKNADQFGYEKSGNSWKLKQ